MAEKSIKEHYAVIYNVNYSFNDRYKLSFINDYTFNRISESLSYLRKTKEIDSHTYHILYKIFKHHFDNYYKVKYLISLEPRINAQKFIGKKKIREFIFKRDKYKCLRCEKDSELTIDHIKPIHLGGENKIANLQTLCKSCNSYKSTKIIDYRK